MRRLLRRCALFSPLAALARARCGGHELKCRAGAGDAKLYYARKLLRIDQNECVHHHRFGRCGVSSLLVSH